MNLDARFNKLDTLIASVSPNDDVRAARRLLETIQEHVEATERELTNLDKDHAKLKKSHSCLKALHSETVRSFVKLIRDIRADNLALAAKKEEAHQKEVTHIKKAYENEIAHLREALADFVKVLNERLGRPRMPWSK